MALWEFAGGHHKKHSILLESIEQIDVGVELVVEVKCVPRRGDKVCS